MWLPPRSPGPWSLEHPVSRWGKRGQRGHTCFLGASSRKISLCLHSIRENSHMVYLHARNVGRYSPCMGIHILLTCFWKGSMNVGWTSVTVGFMGRESPERTQPLCSCLYFAWWAAFTDAMPHLLIPLSDFSLIHSLANSFTHFPQALYTNIHSSVHTHPIHL